MTEIHLSSDFHSHIFFEHRAHLLGVLEANLHVLVRLINTASTDVIMRMIAEDFSPRKVQSFTAESPSMGT